MKLTPVVVLAAAVAAGLAFAPRAAVAQQTIKLDGSSTVFPISEAVAEEFQIAKRGKVRVTVGISGTGGGFKKLCRGEIDISDASRPISRSEMEACAKAGIQYIELPVAYDALTVAINPKNTWVDSMTVAELKKMWQPAAQGKVTTWKDVNPKWPAQPLKLDGDFVARTGVFEAFDSAVDNPKRVRAVGLKEAQIKSHLAVRPDGVSFVSPRLVTPSSVSDASCLSAWLRRSSFDLIVRIVARTAPGVGS